MAIIKGQVDVISVKLLLNWVDIKTVKSGLRSGLILHQPHAVLLAYITLCGSEKQKAHLPCGAPTDPTPTTLQPNAVSLDYI